MPSYSFVAPSHGVTSPYIANGEPFYPAPTSYNHYISGPYPSEHVVNGRSIVWTSVLVAKGPRIVRVYKCRNGCLTVNLWFMDRAHRRGEGWGYLGWRWKTGDGRLEMEDLK
ncbi:hypothetical protein FLONG3_9079 [Fusarium longipes]|uniref:Uncharacterized protein n=1 Tax=Fusarium longipes TaxID=694270 RepID=A0A395S127_9HYPO|nr:hypothetical protein FLONG3_9079 [Fusarium longipes]